jgi:negative regulator of flagellin synthesis FlgM
LKITDQRPVAWNKAIEAYRRPAGVKEKDKADGVADSVQLSADGQLVRELMATAAGDDLRAARIEAIRARVLAGTYNIPPEAVAGAMLKELSPPAAHATIDPPSRL